MVHKCRMITSPGAFQNWPKNGPNWQKWPKNDKELCLLHFICQEPYIIWSWLMVHMGKRRLSPGVLHFFQILILNVNSRAKEQKNGFKWQKTMSVALHIWVYIIWSCFLLHKFKMMIFPDTFFIFSKCWFSGLLGRGGLKGKKWYKMTKICLTPCLRSCASYDDIIKWWYLQQFFFSFFQNSDFLGFLKFISKCCLTVSFSAFYFSLFFSFFFLSFLHCFFSLFWSYFFFVLSPIFAFPCVSLFLWFPFFSSLFSFCLCLIFCFSLIVLPFFVFCCGLVNGGDVYAAGGKINLFLFVMDSFKSQIITAVKKIRNSNRRLDAETIYKAITKDFSSNLILDGMQQKLRKMQLRFKLENKPYQSLDFYNIVQSDTGDIITSSSDILGTFCDKTDTDSDIDLIVLVRTPTIVRNKTAAYLRIIIYSW